ncbi:MAG: GNAT family N-acetyltransferase [Clostridia bacterium]|nr:GNAT family N-acetyltransferase [Clostridia bacterium]
MRAEAYEYLPPEAKEIRETVFLKEQGFSEEYDEIDEIATHIILFEGDTAIATCRVFPGETPDSYILGRLAVSKECRGRGAGSRMLAEAEACIRKKGGNYLTLHSQLHAREFYEKAGYLAYGEIGYEESCPHIWMKKEL